jgi:hypothetical protein
MTQFLGDGVLDRATTAIGQPLLEFILNTTVKVAVAGSLTDQQFAVLKDLDDMLTGPLSRTMTLLACTNSCVVF